MDLSKVDHVMRNGKRYEVVEVKDNHTKGNWERRIHLFDTTCVDKGSEEDFVDRNDFYVYVWNEIRPLQQKKYVPFTVEDAPLFRDRWVVKKSNTKMVLRIDVYNHEGIWTHNEYIPFSDALNECFFDDGTPFGKEVEG